MNKLFFKFRILILIIFIVNCKNDTPEDDIFISNFNSSQPRTFIGPEYWSNPMQDWQIENGELKCLVSKANRNVHILTKKLDTVKGNFKMSVELKVLNISDSVKNNDWVGFSIGSKGEFNDFRDNAIFGKGLNLGITTNGNLFIDKILDNQVNKENKNTIQSGAKLEVELKYSNNSYQLILSLYKPNSNKSITQIIKENVEADKLAGDLVLVSDYNSKGQKNSDKASVSFKHWKISGSKIKTYNENKFGPILFSQYTLSKNTLKLTAQMAPVIIYDEKVKLQIKEDGDWSTISESHIDKNARTATFKIEKWAVDKDIPYRLTYKMDKGDQPKEVSYWEGIIRKEPLDKNEIVVAGFTGNDHQGFPNTDIFEQVKYHNPDILFFSGDQIYEPNGGFGAQRSPIDKAMLDYLRKWYMYGWAYRDLLKDRPTVSITDDHDVYHGNIWGAGGIATPSDFGQGAKAQDAGGYKMPPEWVNMVQRTQTSHLPDPFDAAPVAQGIGTYYTDMVYGGISFAILEDRKFKSAPKGLLPNAQIENGWAMNKKFDMKKDGDVKGAKLLGNRQLSFLDKWSTDWSQQAQMKVLLSQTIFANVATLPKEAMSGAIIPTLRIMNEGDYPTNDRPVSDLDSNGWPQTGRNKAVGIIRKGFAFHLAGDQHLGSTIQYGLDNWNDSGFAFCVPSITNHWPRRWYPSEGGKNRKPNMPKYTGDNEDGFGNKMTVYAVSNPLYTGLKPERIYDRAAGYGIVRLNKKERKITMECWPRQAKPQNGDTKQYLGWPITINQTQNYDRVETAFLPEIIIQGLHNPVVEIIKESSNEILYSIRLNDNSFTPKIFNQFEKYTVKVGEPDTNSWQTKTNISPSKNPIIFNFKK
ncbi:alkaline phosphatase D family protein [Aureibaculum sp. 2210JD6-5]|uniref:alkaline phosphatase D family protein n=1 Tax=Aureibaculum sp. 2210JD6-5 TaxID=3103957 RepID=UPI002AAEF885|nr:alkaline phosphatase D family protein [Aureibaculum sp. 2210JD6-5]MDY7396048.1 alkaline phosphatase D family protein [Aureibaculum sp. 2210JD6-5]